MSLETVKMPALVAPRTYGDLSEYLMRVGNHPNRFKLMNEAGFEDFKGDEQFLLHLMTQNEPANKPLPQGAIIGAKAINTFLEPSVVSSSLAYVGTSIAAVGNYIKEGAQRLFPSFGTAGRAAQAETELN